MKIKKFFKEKFNFLLIVLLSILSFSTFPLFTSAEEPVYSNVLYDLEKDETFSIDDYPTINGDYSLQVIQVAESTAKELFVYVYQPSGNKIATSINLSTDKHNLAYSNYELSLVDYNQSLFKYKVENYNVKNLDLRVYDISSIFREFDENVDEGLPENNNNTIDEISYKIAKIWTAQTYKDEILYTCMDSEVIEITDKYVGFCRYIGGSNFWGSTDYCDSHFVAFSTNKKIENLLEADVYFQTQTVDYQVYGNYWVFGEIQDNYSYMTDKDAIFYQGDNSFWSNYSYEWQRIQTVDNFIANEDFSNVYKGALFNAKVEYKMDDEAKSCIMEKDWVIRFYESEYLSVPGTYGGEYYWTSVSNVSILRLKFESEGSVFNLGAIDNKQSSNGQPSNNAKETISFGWLMWILIAIAALLIFSWIFPSLLNILFSIVKYIIKGLWWLMTAPLSLFKKEKK